MVIILIYSFEYLYIHLLKCLSYSILIIYLFILFIYLLSNTIMIIILTFFIIIRPVIAVVDVI